MSKPHSTLTQKRLKELLNYDPETGVFTRRIQSGKWKASQIAGTIGKIGLGDKRRIIINLLYKRFYAHRLAWLYVFGEWPSESIDHINGDSLDNRINNLRSISHAINCENRHTAQVNNKSGFLGVYWRKNRHVWIAKITIKRRSIHVGSFQTPEEAHAAYLKAKRELHSGCTI